MLRGWGRSCKEEGSPIHWKHQKLISDSLWVYGLGSVEAAVSGYTLHFVFLSRFWIWGLTGLRSDKLANQIAGRFTLKLSLLHARIYHHDRKRGVSTA